MFVVFVFPSFVCTSMCCCESDLCTCIISVTHKILLRFYLNSYSKVVLQGASEHVRTTFLKQCWWTLCTKLYACDDYLVQFSCTI